MREWTKVKLRTKVTTESLLVAACYLLIVNLLFYAFWQINIPKNLLRIGAVALCGLVYLIHSKVRLLDCVYLLAAAYLIAVRGSVSINLAFMVLLAIALEKLDQKRLLQKLNKVHGLMVTAVAVSLALGVVHNETLQFSLRTRNTLGFVQVNYSGMLGYSLFSIYLLSRQNIRLRHLLWTAGADLALLLVTDSRTGLLGVMMLMLLYLAFCMLKRKCAKWFGVLVLFLVFVSPAVWGLPFVNSETLNSLLSNRPMLFTEYIHSNTAVNLIVGGSRVKEVDSFFLLLLYNAGIVIYVCVACITSKAVSSLLDRGMKMEAAFVLSTLVVALFESSLLRPEIPCMYFFWRLVLMEGKPVLGRRQTRSVQMATGKR